MMSQQYLLEQLVPHTLYTVHVKVFVEEAGMGEPVSMTFNTNPTGTYTALELFLDFGSSLSFLIVWPSSI